MSARSVGVALEVLVAIQVAGTIIFVVSMYRFLRRMRARRDGLWESLGSPTQQMVGINLNMWLLFGYLWSKDYATLHDPEFVRAAGFVRALWLAVMINFAVLTIVCVLNANQAV